MSHYKNTNPRFQSLDHDKFALLKSTIARQQNFNDNCKLKNRISMLETEEKKMMKKITDTRKRADQIN